MSSLKVNTVSTTAEAVPALLVEHDVQGSFGLALVIRAVAEQRSLRGLSDPPAAQLISVGDLRRWRALGFLVLGGRYVPGFLVPGDCLGAILDGEVVLIEVGVTLAASQVSLREYRGNVVDELDLLIIYIDGIHFGEQCVIGAVGVDAEGKKHVLGIREGATENAAAAQDLLEHLVAQGVDPQRRRLFVIDGSKALRTAINAVFGAHTPVQRCRHLNGLGGFITQILCRVLFPGAPGDLPRLLVVFLRLSVWSVEA